jgi:type IV pilus assembly PilW-like protein/pilin/secretion family protein with methylation motif
MTAIRTSFLARQRGMGIVEVMVGILIGMIVVAAVYSVFSVAEGYKRTAVGAADAQTTGLFAQFVLAREISNAGTGVSLDAADLGTCTLAAANWTIPASFAVAGVRPIRPIPVLIHDGGGPNIPDSLIVTYSTAPHVLHSVLVVDKPMAAVNDTLYVQSPNGFRAGDRIIVNNKAGNCELSSVTAVIPGSSTGDLTTGFVGLTHPNFANLYISTGSTDGPGVVNLGQAGESMRTLFDVVNGQLRTTDLFANAPANPIAQNLVLMKALYGVDCANNGVVLWTTATATNICGDGLNYTPDDLTKPAVYTSALLARIRAIRIGVVVRSDEPDLKDPALVGQTGVLFNCSTNNAACQGRIALNNTILADGYRHRFYETIVPMRNAIFNDGL